MKEQKRFTNHSNRCFQMRFINGLVLSMNVGACGYNDNHDSYDFNQDRVETDSVECAVWIDIPGHPQHQEWITQTFFPNAEDGKASVVGYVSMEEFQDALVKIMEWQAQRGP
jgi:hypothetical protein